MAEVYVAAAGYSNVPVLRCECGHRRPGGVMMMDEWFRHEMLHVTDNHPEAGMFTCVESLPNPALLPPLISVARYLA